MTANAESVLHELGYQVLLDVALEDAHFDGQGHLNNAAIAQLFNDMRITYIRGVAGPWWGEYLLGERIVVALRELHISYESEGLPGETFRGAMRYLRREGKAAVFEQCLCETTTGRIAARAWGVQLLAHNGRVVDWPPRYFEAVEATELRTIERREKSSRVWGPGQ